MSNIEQAKAFIEEKLNEKPTIGLVLGSGLGVLADEIEDAVIIPYDEIPHFTKSTVVGHKGQLVIGKLQGKQVVAMQGRFHYYEGHELEAVVFPIRVMKAIGVETIIVTNAAGGINKEFDSGNLMLISDHLNLTFRNPLIGPNDDTLGVRFPDMSEAYSKRLRELAKEVANELAIDVKEGVYVGLLGPSYETPAEIRMLATLGGDAVGMSTVPEVIVARHMGVEVLGISCISNMAAGILEQPLSHDEVMETTERVKSEFLALVKGVIEKA
ncbi:purine-nucleoside phosphorylase [Brevibacillus daliensis]|uniref:purine-nucleoside phosphorylase n=1 Tax=Brevibacillus daliensis TaxID=2892995 RepID=UPI001E541F4B|nr:purine-nucleoside phosphorylase [Brevibacillus daliensis]